MEIVLVARYHNVSHSEILQRVQVFLQEAMATDKSQALYTLWNALLWRPYID